MWDPYISALGDTVREHTDLQVRPAKPHPNVKAHCYGVNLLPSLSPQSYILQLFSFVWNTVISKQEPSMAYQTQTVSWMYHYIPDSVWPLRFIFFFSHLREPGRKKKYRLKRVERQETYQHQQPELLPVRSGSLFKFFVTNIIWAAEHTVYIF